MGASITQRPDLFAAVECGYPLLDMLRYQNSKKDGCGRRNTDRRTTRKQFAYLLKYSPYQNVKKARHIRNLLLYRSSDTRVDRCTRAR